MYYIIMLLSINSKPIGPTAPLNFY